MPRRNVEVAALLVECKAAAQQFEAHSRRSHELLYLALVKILELDSLIGQSEENAADYARLLKERRVRTTRASARNRFTSMVKLVFGKIPANTVSRYAATLRYASSEGVEPGRLPEFIGGNGGIARCASLDRSRDDRAASGEDNFSRLIGSLRASGPIELTSQLENCPSRGLFLVVGEMTTNDPPKFYRVVELLPRELERILRLLPAMTAARERA